MDVTAPILMFTAMKGELYLNSAKGPVIDAGDG
jgi:hypothetical protein